ncbi:hypothetical protein EJ04DRAFT_526326 [Polyplosphaeria fusca]|uniref:DUF3176 domain containing protein n=1 Tax=Polyplosphaeria fusca TaxID=682080 RepID=A0A9P4UZR2_9PLEO|nr:hypothetical protein EJ04DRAFT_526326 [Polyplosphaeria fusca]
MPGLPVSPYWSTNPDISIYLDTSRERNSSDHRDNSAYICTICGADSRVQPIHCVSIASPAPPSYSSIAPKAPSSKHLAVPVLTVETPQRRFSNLPPPRPALQFDPKGTTHLRFRRSIYSPVSPPTDTKESTEWGHGSSIGLGIPDVPFRPDTSPVTSKQDEGGNGTDNLPHASNLAQRIEQKLWNYSASRNVVKRWLLEIISWSLSAACMAGIMIVLFVYKDKRIPKWPLGLTLNAYISVLSKVASASLLLPVSEAIGQLKWGWFRNSRKMWDFEIFDNASRGPWGSLQLLVRTKGKTLAALGAGITLFALALDPFFQQVVEYPDAWKLQPDTGSIPRATGYVPYLSGTEYLEGMESLEADQNMIGITHHSFYDNGTLPTTFGKGIRAEVPMACPSSNCTWPQYETLAVCSECTPVADMLEFKCVNQTLDWVQAPPVDPETEQIAVPSGVSCGWYLKADEPQLMTGYNVDIDTPFSRELLLMRALPLYDVFTREQLPGYPFQLNYTRNPLAHFVVASGETVENIQRNATPIAHECLLSWCVQTIASSYSEGGYSEVINSTLRNHTVGPSPWLAEKMFDDNGVFAGTLTSYIENITLTSENGTQYMVDNNTHSRTLFLFDDILPSSYTLANTTDINDALLRYKTYKVKAPVTRNLTFNPWIYNNISAHLDQLAISMTNLMRSSISDIEMVSGPAFDLESFVDVRWGWLALPLGLLGFTLFFLMATVAQSSIKNETLGVWKTSAIAMLLYGLSDEMQKKITSSNHSDATPRTKAKETKVRWAPVGGWTFSENTLSPNWRQSRNHALAVS